MMTQPTGQVLLDSGSPYYGYFWYANDTGLWDARNGVQAPKTGTGAVTATGEGGTNVANSNGTTYYSTGALTSLGDPCTVGFKVKRTSATGDKGMVIGNRASTDTYFWIRASEIRAFSLTTANSNPDSWATFHYVRQADGIGKVYKNGAYLGDCPWTTPRTIDSIMDGYSGGSLALDGALEYMHIIPGLAADATQVASLYANPYQALQSTAASATISSTTSLPSFSGSLQVSAITSIAATITIPSFNGSASTGSSSTIVTATTSTPVFSGNAVGDTSQGTLILPTLKNNTGTVLANETGATVHVYAVSTGDKVVTKPGQTTNASGVMTVTDALILAGIQYRVVVVLSSNAEGMDKVTAT